MRYNPFAPGGIGFATWLFIVSQKLLQVQPTTSFIKPYYDNIRTF